MARSPQHIQHLEAAKICIRREQYGNAIAHFVFLAHVAPCLKPVFEEDFSMALRHWAELLESHGELEKLFVCLQESLKLYPDNVVILNNTGATLLRLGFTDKAVSCFRRALHVDPGNVRAKENLENVANLLVERWHFRMLNDKKRNTSYKQAISKAIAKGYDIVLDVGSGTGILSMFAVESGAKEVYACEMSKTMYDMAQDVLKANNMESAVRMVHKKSTELTIGDDIPHRVSLVITETLDCGLLGEGILSTLKHAWNDLLVPFVPHSINAKQISKVIPAGAIIYAMVVMCKEIRNQTYSKPSVCGVKMFPTSIIGGERILEKAENRPLARHFDQLEPYSTECLKSVRGGFTPLSHPFRVVEYNFNDPTSLHTDKVLMIDIPSTEAGQVDAIVAWFDLHLDEEITLSTGPEDESLCWEQAVFPVYTQHQNLDRAPIQVAKGDVMEMAGHLTQDCLRMQFLGIKTEIAGKSFRDEEEQQESLTEGTAHGSLTEEITVIPPSYMRRLNDEVYNDAYSDVISGAVKRVKHLSPLDVNSAGNCERSKKFHECNILDITYGPALSAIFASREEVDCVLISSPYDTTWIKRILNGNSLPSVIKYGPRKLEEIIKDQRTWSVLISDIVEPCGVICPQVVEDIVFSRGCLLKEEGFQIIPLGFTVYCMCIESPFLLANCHILSEENTLGLNIGQFMNRFQVETHIDIDLTTLDFLAVTDQVELFNFNFMQTFESDSQMLSLLETKSEHRVQVIKSGTIHALPYWFTLHMDSSNSISTYSGAYPGSHWKQAVIVLKEKVPVIAGQEILISASCINSGISIEVKTIKE